jgi:hypothetical protein
MKSSVKSVSIFVCGAAVASLPFTLSLGNAHAQNGTPQAIVPNGQISRDPAGVAAPPITALSNDEVYVYASVGNAVYRVRKVDMSDKTILPKQRAERIK